MRMDHSPPQLMALHGFSPDHADCGPRGAQSGMIISFRVPNTDCHVLASVPSRLAKFEKVRRDYANGELQVSM